MLIYGLYAGTAYPEAVLTSKAYVDNKVPAYNSATESQSLLTDTTTTGTIAKRAIFTDGTTYVAGTHATQIPTMGAVMSAISSGVSAGIDTLSWTSTETTAANAYSTTFDGTTGNWPAADGLKLVNGTALGTALSLKQNIIPAHASTTTDFVITDSTTDGVIAKRAVLGRPFRESTFSSVAGKIARGAAFDGASPTILAPYPVGWGFANQQEAEDSIVTTGMLNAAFGDIWPFITNRQAKLSANDSTTYPDGSIVTYGTLGTPGTVGIATAPTYDANDQLTNGNWVPTMGAVMSAISSATPTLPTGTAGNVVTYDTNGNIGGSVATYDASGTYTPATDAGKIATAAAVETKQSKIPASTNGYLATHSGSEGTFGTPVNPATFQTAITTGMVDFNDGVADLPAITTYDTTGGLVANKIGILDYETIAHDERYLGMYNSTNSYGAEMDNYVPTVRAVAEGLHDVESMIAPLPWNTAEQNATGAYSTTFANSGTNVWPTADAGKVVKSQTFANAMATKQNKIGVEDDDLILGQQGVTGMRAVLAPTDTAGIVNQIGLWDADGGDPESWDLDSAYGDADERQLIARSIPTVGAVEVGLNSLKDQIDDIDIPDISNLQTKIAASSWRDANNTVIPGVVVSSGTSGVVNQRLLLDKPDNLRDEALTNLVLNNNSNGIKNDINSSTVVGLDVRKSIPTLMMTTAIANAAADQKQSKITGHASGAADALLTDSTTDGVVQKRTIFTDGTTYVAGTHANQIPTMGAVMSAISGGTTALPWATAEQNATGAYNTTFADSMYGQRRM